MLNFYNNNKKDFWLCVLWAMGFSFYHLCLVGMVKFVGVGMTSTYFSMVYRAGYLVLTGCLFFTLSRRRAHWPGYFGAALAVFLTLYFVRLCFDGLALQRVNFVEFFLKSFGTTFIPMFAFMVIPSKESARLIFKVMLFFQAVLVMSFAFVYRDIMATGAYRGAQYRSEGKDVALLNAHMLSYNGAVLCAFLFWRYSLFQKYPKLLILLRDAMFFLLGGFMVLFGGSRGAILSLAAVVLASLFSIPGKLRIKVLVIALLVVSVLGAVTLQVGSGGGVDRFSALVTQVESGDENAGSGRAYLWGKAAEQFLHSPLQGSAIVELTSNFFPHNHILEAFMAIGIIGGGGFLVISYFAWYYATALLRRRSIYGWIAVLFIFNYVEGMVSGSLYRYDLWFSIIAVVSVGSYVLGSNKKKI